MKDTFIDFFVFKIYAPNSNSKIYSNSKHHTD